MREIQEIERRGTSAVKRLRLKKLQSGYPFMINSRDLPGNQCYLEYPDGSISLVTLVKSAGDFTVIRKLTRDEQNNIRVRYNLALR
ncbi:MAG: hypothetical protein ABI707_05185 [Ferruginibacter sp.]